MCIIAVHPVQYHAPLYRQISRIKGLNAKVLYLDSFGIKGVQDKDFVYTDKWDMPLFSGYSYKFLKNYSITPYEVFFARLNPGIIKEIFLNKYDVVLIQGYAFFSYWLALFSAKVARAKVIFRGETGFIASKQPGDITKFIKKRILSLFFYFCDIIMYSCSGNRAHLEHYGADKNKLIYFPCAVDNEYLQQQRKRFTVQIVKERRQALGISPESMVVMFCARFIKQKRPYDLIDAVKKVKGDITLLFVGDGIERRRMEGRCTENNIHSVFTGFKNQSQLAEYYSMADIACVISDNDASPKSVNEAMNFALPVIVTHAVGTARDMVKDNENGFIIKTGDINTLAEKIDYLNRHRQQLRYMGERSLEIVKNFSFKEDIAALRRALDMLFAE